jgi:hypothetical protein
MAGGGGPGGGYRAQSLGCGHPPAHRAKDACVTDMPLAGLCDKLESSAWGGDSYGTFRS